MGPATCSLHAGMAMYAKSPFSGRTMETTQNPGEATTSNGWTPRKARWSMLLMSVCFSTGEAALVGVIVLGAGLAENPALPAVANGCLYLAFVMASFVAPAALDQIGSLRWGIALGLYGFSTYAASLLVPIFPLQVLCATVAGAGGALMWTAEGAYLSTLSQIHVKCSQGVDLTKATTELSSIFATVLPVVLTAGKLAASAVLMLTMDGAAQAPVVLFAGYAAAIALSALCASTCIRDVDQPGPVDSTASTCAAVRARTWATFGKNRSPEMLKLLANNIAFGLMASFIPYHGTLLVSQDLGPEHVGWVFAWSGMVSAAVAAVSGRGAGVVHRNGYILLGATANVASAMLCAALSIEGDVDGVDHPPQPTVDRVAPIMVVFFLYGIGIAAWQGPTMAVFAEIFVADPQPAFANLKLHSGLATSVGFFMFPRMGAVLSGMTCALVAVAGGVSYSFLVPTLRRTSAGSRTRHMVSVIAVADGQAPMDGTSRVDSSSTRGEGQELVTMRRNPSWPSDDSDVVQTQDTSALQPRRPPNGSREHSDIENAHRVLRGRSWWDRTVYKLRRLEQLI